MTTPEYIVFSLFIVLGLISMAASILNMEWFFKTEQSRMVIKWFGYRGARIAYGILGLVLIICGILGLGFDK